MSITLYIQSLEAKEKSVQRENVASRQERKETLVWEALLSSGAASHRNQEGNARKTYLIVQGRITET